ncbi:hypothetical protein ABLE92_02460 [Gordonia sp. VNQ95]|uniref:hypothetical protein n=1 Tax=Gordonia TaxID=2053 RepID=UPI0032B5B640
MSPDNTPPPPRGPSTFRRAVIYDAVIIGLGIATLVVAVASSDGLRTVLVIAAPVIVGGGAIGALWRTYTEWRSGGQWQVWQGAAWFLLALFLVFLFSTAPYLLE